MFKRDDLFSGLAVLLSVGAIFAAANAARSNKRLTESQDERTAELQALIDQSVAQSANGLREELVTRLDGIIEKLGLVEPNPTTNLDTKELVKLSKTDPAMAKMLKDAIESVILKQMADQLAAVDWEGELSSEEIQKLLRKAARGSSSMGFSDVQRVDVSGIDGIDGKIGRILEEFEGSNHYSSNNALVKQMLEMGDEAIEPLLSQLGGKGSAHGDFAKNMAITDTLEQLLSEDHEDIILEQFAQNGHFAKLIKKYQFPAAEDEVMNKIAYPSNGYVDQNVIDAAVRMNSDRSIPLLVDHVSNGQNVAYAATQLAAEGIDITEPLRLASSHANGIWEKASLVELCLDRNMPEGYDLAIAVLRSNEQHAEHSQEQVYQYVRKQTGISGSYDEMADWLQENSGY